MCGITVKSPHTKSGLCPHSNIYVDYCEECPFISKRPSQSGFQSESQIYKSRKCESKLPGADKLAECPNWNKVQHVFSQGKCLCQRWESWDTWSCMRRHRYDWGVHVSNEKEDMLDALASLAREYETADGKKAQEWFLEEHNKIKQIVADGEELEEAFTNVTDELERLAKMSRERGGATKSWWSGESTVYEATKSLWSDESTDYEEMYSSGESLSGEKPVENHEFL